MVETEQQQSEEETTPRDPPKPEASPSNTTLDSPSLPPPPTDNGSGGADSDGFETASEREVSDEEGADATTERHKEAAAAAGEAKCQDSLNDDASKQEALIQANDVKLEGNRLFGEGKYEEALLQYETALHIVPEMPSSVDLHSICYTNRAVCFLKLGKYKDTIRECTKALELNPSYIKALVRRGEGHEKLDQFEEAIADMKNILELDPSNDQAKRTIHRLEPLVAEKREKMKEEMIAKLKEMGNSLLGRFGMSVDNFKAVKDPNTGSYSISFQR